MQSKTILVVSVLTLGLALSACGAATPVPVADRPMESTLPVQPTETTMPTATIPAPTPTPSIALTTYQDADSGFTFDYPTGWMVDAIVLGSRAPSGYQITSWSHEPGMVSEVPAGETDINIVVQLWEPKSDLNAFVEMRKQAWDASGITIVSAADFTLANGKPARIFFVQGVDGAQGYSMFTTLGENYLVVSGSGDLEKIDIVARSIR